MACNRRNRVQRSADFALMLSFLAIIVLPAASMLATKSSEAEIERLEKRRAAAFPKLEWRKPLFGYMPRLSTGCLREFPRAFGSWFGDRVGYRQQLLHGYHLAKNFGLTVENRFNPISVSGLGANSPVIVGRNGWLFYNGDRLLDDYRCTDPFTPEQLEQWRRVLCARQSWLAQQGIRYCVLVAPNAQTIYAEQMPANINRVGHVSRFDQLLDYLRIHGGIDIIDPRPELMAGKSQYPTYYKTDTHWNQLGAFLAYEKLMTHIAQWFPEAKPRPLSDFQIKEFDRQGGELAAMTGVPWRFSEHCVDLIPLRSSRAQSAVRVHEVDNPPRIEVANPDALLTSAVIIRDSFVTDMEPHINEHFRKVTYEWTYDFPHQLIERERPCIVIEEFVERTLMVLKPKNPSPVDNVLTPTDLSRGPNSNQQR